MTFPAFFWYISKQAVFRSIKNGGAERDRTVDLLHAMQALFQLSYGPENSGDQKAISAEYWQEKKRPCRVGFLIKEASNAEARFI